MEQQVFDFIRKNALFSSGNRVAAAVSGGADSMALLTVLLSLRDRLGIRVTVAHFHHGLRGEEADRDAAFVQAYCEEHRIPFVLGRGDVRQRAEETGESIEEAARALRLGFLESLEADRIATAHNADDNAETVLLHLLRGTGLRGLAGIPVKRERYVRPLLGCSREEILRYLSEKGVPHIEDSSNEADGCLRNRLRHHVLPLLKAENPGFLQTLSRSGEILRQEDDYLSSLASEAGKACLADNCLSCERLLDLDPVLRRRVLLGQLRELSLENPSAIHLEALEQLILSPSPSASLSLPEGWTAIREYDRLRFVSTQNTTCCPSVSLKIPGDTILSEIGLKISAKVTENSNFGQKNAFPFAFRYDMISASAWRVRARQPGDTLLLRQGHRTLKRLLIDRKIPKHQRDQLPVLLCGDRIAGIPGLIVSRDFLPVPGHPVLELTLTPLSENNSADSVPAVTKENPIE